MSWEAHLFGAIAGLRGFWAEGSITILAVGPLVSEALAASIAEFTGQDYLYFYDAIAPVIEADSIDREVVFAASRYGKGGGEDYLNCPMSEQEYERFIAELLAVVVLIALLVVLVVILLVAGAVLLTPVVYRLLVDAGWLDLESRKGKAPGGYQETFYL